MGPRNRGHPNAGLNPPSSWCRLPPMKASRRQFLKTASLGAAALAVGRPVHSANPPRIPRRPFGRHPEQLSVIGFGGIVVKDAEQQQANRIVAESVERGVNYFDVAPGYGDAEIKLGPALEPYRKECFLACKTGKRDAAGAEQQFNESLKRLRTDHFDLYQLHGITDVQKDVDPAFAAGGVMEFLIRAKKEGRIRYLGFSAHSIAAATAALERFEFDSVLFPVNFASWMAHDFGPQILELAADRGAARLALKPMARQRWAENDPLREEYKKCWYHPITDRAEADLALRFTLAQPVTSAIPPGDERLFRLALDLAMNLRPLERAEAERLQALAREVRSIFP